MARMLARVVLLFVRLVAIRRFGTILRLGVGRLRGCAGCRPSCRREKIVFPDYYSDDAARVARYLDTIRPSISYGFEYAPLKMPVVLAYARISSPTAWRCGRPSASSSR